VSTPGRYICPNKENGTEEKGGLSIAKKGSLRRDLDELDAFRARFDFLHKLKTKPTPTWVQICAQVV